MSFKETFTRDTLVLSTARNLPPPSRADKQFRNHFRFNVKTFSFSDTQIDTFELTPNENFSQEGTEYIYKHDNYSGEYFINGTDTTLNLFNMYRHGRQIIDHDTIVTSEKIDDIFETDDTLTFTISQFRQGDSKLEYELILTKK